MSIATVLQPIGRWWLVCLAMASGLGTVAPIDVVAQGGSGIPAADHQQIVSAIAADDWTDLHGVVRAVRAAVSAPSDCMVESPLRLLHGHTALWRGEHTVAVRQFYCEQDSIGSSSIMTWVNWTADVAAQYPSSATAAYLVGDALARDGRFAAASAAFARAVELDPAFAPAWSAGAVVKWLRVEGDQSLETDVAASLYEEVRGDLARATDLAPDFGDAWANRGVVDLRDHVFDAASRGFARAVEIDPTFWLARNGGAVAALMAGRAWEFDRELSAITLVAPDTPFLDLNTGRIRPIDPVRCGGTRGIGTGIKDVIGGIRGGVCLPLNETNSLTVSTGSVRAIGTGFTLGYPAPAVTRES